MSTDNSKNGNINTINSALDNATGPFHLKTLLTAGMGFFTDAYDLFIIGTVIGILPLIGWTNMTKSASALVGSISLIAAVVGALLFGRLLDYLGRKAVYGTELILLVIGALGSAFLTPFNNVTALIMWRFILGIGIGGDYATSSVIMAEYSNIKSRGKYVGSILSMQSIGLVVSSLLALAFLKGGVPLGITWKALLAVGAIPAVIVIYYRRKMPEPPRYTVSMGRSTEAAKNLKSYTGIDVNVSADNQKVEAPWYVLFKDRTFLITLIGTAGSWFLMDWAFYGNSIMSGKIFSTIITAKGLAGLTLSTEYSALIFIVAALPGYWLATFTLDKLGRKPIQLLGFAMLALSYSILALFPSIDSAAYIMEFLFLYGFSYFFMMFGPNVTTFVYPPEVFPVTARGLGTGISAAGGKTGAFIGTFVDAFIIVSGLSVLMTILAIFSTVAFVITLFFLPEPKRKSIIYAAESIDGNNASIL